jgi:nucleoid-associated protein YgaU
MVAGIVLSTSAQASTAGQRTTAVTASATIRTQARHASVHYTVRSGDTLSSIARKVYGHASRWPALWWKNRGAVPNPDSIRVGQRLYVSRWHPIRAWLMTRATRAIPAPAPVRQHSSSPAAPSAPAPAPAQHATPVAASSGSGAPGSFQSCVITRESGGNPSAVNASSGAGGLYGFLPSTWQALGHSGLPENASVAEQNQAFQQEYAQSGGSAWSAYDGC